MNKGKGKTENGERNVSSAFYGIETYVFLDGWLIWKKIGGRGL